jgi:hypothetical protein
MGRRGLDRMIFGCNQCLSPLGYEVYMIQHYVIKFVSDLRQVGCFLRVLQFPPPIKPTLSHNVVSCTPHNLVVIGIDYIQISFDQDHDGPYSAISWREQVIRWRGDERKNTQYSRSKSKYAWLEVMIMCPSGATCLLTGCCLCLLTVEISNSVLV